MIELFRIAITERNAPSFVGLGIASSAIEAGIIQVQQQNANGGLRKVWWATSS